MLAGKRVHREIILAMVTAVLLVAATSRPVRAEGTCTSGLCYGIEYINYFSNAAISNGKGYVRITDPLEANGSGSVGQPDEICAMIYVFDVREGLQECCGCPVTEDGLLTLSYGGINGDLNSTPQSVQGQFFYVSGGATMVDGVVRILSALPNSSTGIQSGFNTLASGTAEYLSLGVGCDRYSGHCCDPRGPLTLITTIRAWADHIQSLGTSATQLTNVEFEENPIVPSDANNLASFCRGTLSTGRGECQCGNEFIAEPNGNQPTGGQ